MAYLKPQSPLQDKSSGDYFYPLTTSDQVILDNGSRLSGSNFLSVDKYDVVEGEISLNNADTLGGYSAEEYVRHAQLHEILNIIYPIGSIYISVNSINPTNLFGGTWERIKDRFLLSAGDTYGAGSTGGEATHTLTVDEMPNHVHALYAHAFAWGALEDISVYASGADAVSGKPSTNALSTAQGKWNCTMDSGSNQPHNNMPPYLVVYMWKRTT